MGVTLDATQLQSLIAEIDKVGLMLLGGMLGVSLALIFARWKW